MNRWIPVIGSTLLLTSACTTGDELCQRGSEQCEVRYDRNYGYYRECRYIEGWCVINLDMTNSGGSGGSSSQAGSGGASGSAGTRATNEPNNGGAAQNTGGQAGSQQGGSAGTRPNDTNEGAAQPAGGDRYTAFEFPCTRDSQCGPGRCSDGNCYYGCNSDAQCGSGDRCAVESGMRICTPDPNPPIECTRSAQCEANNVCLNGGCREQCTDTAQCTNSLDRCVNGVCTPDRRPLGECVVDTECAEGLACLDGKCVEACWQGGATDAGACVAPEQPQPKPPEPTTPDPEQPDGTEPGEPPTDGEGTAQPDAGAPLPIIR